MNAGMLRKNGLNCLVKGTCTSHLFGFGLEKN